MKIAVLIMSVNAQPSLRNVQAMKDTFIKFSNETELKHEYDFYTYYYDNSLKDEEILLENDPDYSNYYIMRIGGTETVYRTYEKTYLAYAYIINNCKPYEKFIRINTSTYLNMKLLDTVIESADDDNIYANAINTFLNANFKYLNGLYVRGDFYIVSRSIVQGVLESGKDLMYSDTLLKNRPAVTHVDDTLFGYAFINLKGKSYFEHLHCIYYNFIPQEKISLMWLSCNFNKMAIATRLKTTPQGEASGYSWDDNALREMEPDKMKTIHSYIKTFNYDENITINDIITDYENERVTLFLNPINMKISKIKEVLRQFNTLNNG